VVDLADWLIDKVANARAQMSERMSIGSEGGAADPARINLRGLEFRRLGRYQEALAAFNAAISLAPNYAEARANRSHLRLLLGDYGGWDEFDWRWRTEEEAHTKLNILRPLWRGEPIEGRSILVFAEWGFGDAIQFVRYVPLLKQRGAKVTLLAQAQLVGLFGSIGADSVVFGTPDLPSTDFYCQTLSLPLAFGTRLDTIPARVPYLAADKARIAKWKPRLPKLAWHGTKRMRRIGVVWAGNPGFKGDATRSVGLRNMAPLLAGKGVQFVSLQQKLRDGDSEILRAHPNVLHLGDALEDFQDTAAIISLLDLVITTDTSVAHLAGALAKPVWVLLEFTPDWRWLLEREDCPWYPTARLFRQRALGDWHGVVERVRAALA
jgi:tetratricopeptide (TPR) repeat protein